jgi:4a-hydroxytetrahydrobiopterin dehydratase
MKENLCSVTLQDRSCEACRGDASPLSPEEYAPFLAQLGGNWEVLNEKVLIKTYTFPDFKAALAFVNHVGSVAELEQHHPDIELSWGKVVVRIWTHKIGGLSLNDFILAAKTDAYQTA